MLVLSRQKDQTIMIGDDIEITIVDVKGDKVRIGIRAPADVPVHRKEVYLAIKAENVEASNTEAVDLAHLAKLFPGHGVRPRPPDKLGGQAPPEGWRQRSEGRGGGTRGS